MLMRSDNAIEDRSGPGLPVIQASPPPRRSAEPSRPPGLIDLRAFWFLVRRRARLIGLVAFAVLAMVVAALFAMTPRYTANAVLIVDPRQQRVLPSEAVLSGIGADAAAVESQVEVIQSTSIARHVIDELGLAQDPEFTRPSALEAASAWLREQIGRPKPVVADAEAQRVLTRFQDALRVQRRGLTYVLELRFLSDSPVKAARIANAVAAAYMADQTAAKSAATVQAADWLNQRLDDLRRRANEADRAVATFKSQNNIVDTGEGRTLAERQVAELNQQLILARARTAEARARLDQVAKASAASVGAGAIPEALLSPVVANLRAQYADMARREAEGLSTLGPRHPAMGTLRAQMADIRVQITHEIQRVTAGVRNEFEVAQSRERSLERSLGELKAQSARIDQAGVTLRGLEREAQATRTLLDQTLLRFKEMAEQEGLQRPDARVLSPAVPPLRPSEPKAGLMLLAGLLGGLVAGLGTAALAESFTQGFRTSRDVEATLGLPVLGTVPLIGSWKGSRGAGRMRRSSEAGRERSPAGQATRLGRYGVDQPLTPFGEAVRSIRTRLRSAAGRPQVLAVVSAAPSEGKSTLAVNLAHSFAKSGLSTLLVDVDVRKSSATAGQAPPGGGRIPGLMQMLAGASPANLPFYHDVVSGLNVLPLGHVEDVAAASELLTGPGMGDLLERLRQDFEIIVLDGPPLLPFVDGRNLLERADAGLFVVEWNRTDPDSASAALDSLGAAAGKVIGALLNKVDLRSQRLYDYGRDYGGSYALAG